MCKFLSLAIKISIDCSNKPMILFHALWIELGMPKDWKVSSSITITFSDLLRQQISMVFQMTQASLIMSQKRLITSHLPPVVELAPSFTSDPLLIVSSWLLMLPILVAELDLLHMAGHSFDWAYHGLPFLLSLPRCSVLQQYSLAGFTSFPTI